VLRALVAMAAVEVLGAGFPWGTLAVNVIGSFAIGFYATLTGPDGRVFAGTRQRQFVLAGFCGGFTTFSLFSLEAVQRVWAGDWPGAAFYAAVSVTTWLAAVWLGFALASRLNRLRG